MTTLTRARIEPQHRPLEVPRSANCRHCGSRVHARAGDTWQGYAVWRHAHNGSSWCELNQEAGVFTMADPDLSTLEWLEQLYDTVQVLPTGSRGHYPVEVPYGQPLRRAADGFRPAAA